MTTIAHLAGGVVRPVEVVPHEDVCEHARLRVVGEQADAVRAVH